MGQMSSILKYLEGIQELVRRMAQIDDSELIYKGPWVRSAQQRLFQILETDYGFPRATCRSLVNLIWDFLTETFGEKLHEGQITFHVASADGAAGKEHVSFVFTRTTQCKKRGSSLFHVGKLNLSFPVLR